MTERRGVEMSNRSFEETPAFDEQDGSKIEADGAFETSSCDHFDQPKRTFLVDRLEELFDFA